MGENSGGTLAWTIVAAVAAALTVAGMFLAWLVNVRTRDEHRFTALESEAKTAVRERESLRAAILGLVEESKRDAERTQDFTDFAREGISDLKQRVARVEERIKK